MKKLRLFKPYMSWRARLYALIVLMGTQLAEGPVVKIFEKEFAKMFGFDRRLVVSVNSGTSALELAYELAGIGPGDEVITPVLTCTATNLPLIHRGAKIVFADIEGDLNVSLTNIEKKITPKTKAIVFVHFGGNNRGLGQLLVLARRYNLRVIEDAAQAVGSPFWGKADFTCVSLQAIKTLTSGDGGFLICSELEDAYTAKKLRWFGYDRDEKQKVGDTDLEIAGYKYHMNDISAAIGLGNLRSIKYAFKRRDRARATYRQWDIRGRLLVTGPWLVILRHPKALMAAQALKENGIPSGQYHYRNDKYSVFGGADAADLPIMDLVEKQYLLLPFHHDITPSNVDRIMEIVTNAII